MVDEHEELAEEDPTEWESTEEEEEELVKYDDGQESFKVDNEDFEGINEIKYDSVDVGGGGTDIGGDGGSFGGIESEGVEIEFKGLPGESKLKNPFKYFKE